MSIFDYSYSYFNTYLVPVYRRLPNKLALIKAWLSPLEWLRNNIWNYGKNGSLGYNYDGAVFYLKGQIANYGGNTYEAIVDTVGNTPNMTAYWTLVSSNMVGWDERITYNGKKKSLEFMLYRYFGNYDLTLNFQTNIPNTSTPKSIYITNSSISNQFISYDTFGSASFLSSSDGGDGVYLDYSPTTINFAINIPNSTASLVGGTSNCTKIVNGLVKKYCIAGVSFSVNYY